MPERLNDLEIFRKLGPASRAALLRGTRVQQGRKNQTLVQQGDMLSSVFFLLDGELRIYTIDADGKEATLYLLRPGEVCLLSLNTAFSDGRYPAWVSIASNSARFALLPGKALRSLFSDEPLVQELVLRSLTSTVRELLTHLDEVLTCRLSQRIERFVLRNCDGGGRLEITISSLPGIWASCAKRCPGRFSR